MPLHLLERRLDRLDGHIGHRPAVQAPNVSMPGGFAIKPPLLAGKLKLLDLPFLGQQLKVTVHRCQTYLRQPLPDPLVQLVGGRVSRRRSKLLQDDVALVTVTMN